MFNFSNAVNSILLEQDPPAQDQGTEQTQVNAAPAQTQPWLNGVLKKHNDLFGTTVNLTDVAVGNAIFSALKASYASEQTALNNIGTIRLLDFFQQLYDVLPAPKPSTWPDFIKKINVPTGEIADFGQKYFDGIKNISQDRRVEWDVATGKIRKAWQQAQSAGDKLAAVALNTYNNESVIDTVQSIVNKRISVITRISKLKNPKTPFGRLIEDIFKQPEQYAAGQKKYSSDFEAVDDLYIRDIIKIALAAKEFYASEITNLKLQQQVQDSFAGFSELIDMLLNEYDPLPSRYRNMDLNPQQQTSQAKPKRQRDYKAEYARRKELKAQRAGQQNQPQQIDKRVQEQIYQKALNDVPNRVNFLQGIPVQYSVVNPQSGEDTGQLLAVDPKQYTIGNIQKIETTEAKNLVTALQNIAQYVKKKPGAGEIASKTLGAMGALRVGMGPVG